DKNCRRLPRTSKTCESSTKNCAQRWAFRLFTTKRSVPSASSAFTTGLRAAKARCRTKPSAHTRPAAGTDRISAAKFQLAISVCFGILKLPLEQFQIHAMFRSFFLPDEDHRNIPTVALD